MLNSRVQDELLNLGQEPFRVVGWWNCRNFTRGLLSFQAGFETTLDFLVGVPVLKEIDYSKVVDLLILTKIFALDGFLALSIQRLRDKLLPRFVTL